MIFKCMIEWFHILQFFPKNFIMKPFTHTLKLKFFFTVTTVSVHSTYILQLLLYLDLFITSAHLYPSAHPSPSVLPSTCYFHKLQSELQFINYNSQLDTSAYISLPRVQHLFTVLFFFKVECTHFQAGFDK